MTDCTGPNSGFHPVGIKVHFFPFPPSGQAASVSPLLHKQSPSKTTNIKVQKESYDVGLASIELLDSFKVQRTKNMLTEANPGCMAK